MAYECPRCGGAVKRDTNVTAGAAFGLVGMLLSIALSSFSCEQCGPVPGREFPASVRTEMFAGALAMLATVVLLVVGLVYFLVYLA